MKRATGYVGIAFLLSLSLTSCEQMFTTNIFSDITHPKPTVSDMAGKSPEELATYIESDANMTALAEDEELKNAALATLESAYSDPTASATEKQMAAATAATISIETVESASSFSSSLLGSLTVTAASGSTEDLTSSGAVIDLIKESLGSELSAQLESSETPPESFVALIDAFVEAYGAYSALGESVEADGYSSDAGITESEKNGIAVNAIISFFVSSVAPSDPGTTRAEALWAALRDPDGAGSTLEISDLSDMESLSVYSLLTASSIGSLLGGE